MRRVGAERLSDLYSLNEADVRAKGRDFDDDLDRLARLKAHVARVVAAGAALTTKDLCVTGHDLMKELAMKPGPAMGRLLAALLEEVVEDPTKNERATLLARAKELLDEIS
jgi:hypothetical protein